MNLAKLLGHQRDEVTRRLNHLDSTVPKDFGKHRRQDNLRVEEARCATAGSTRNAPRRHPARRSGSSDKIPARSRNGKRCRQSEVSSESEYEASPVRKYCSSSSSYNTGASQGSDSDIHRRGMPDASELSVEQELALKKALDNVTWETMKQSEMMRKIVEDDGCRSRAFTPFPGRAQLAELEDRGYTLSEKVGSGSYANVYIAHYTDPSTRKRLDLACKLCDRSIAPTDVVKKFLPREIEVLTHLNHPYVIQLHSILQQNDKMYIFMRFAENGDLLEWIKKHGVLKEQHARIWFRQLVMGLDYLHDMEIVHRDLKCENVLITKRNNIKIADFGFSRFCVEDGKRILSTTFCGSAAYAAPEVVSASPYNPKLADVWSLGVILFIMLNGTMPFDDSNLQRLLNDQMSRNWSFRRSLKKVISLEARETVTKILEPDTIRRMYLDRIQKTWFFRMSQEIKKYKSFKNYSAEFMKTMNRLYAGPQRDKDVDEPINEFSSRLRKHPMTNPYGEGSGYVSDGL